MRLYPPQHSFRVTAGEDRLFFYTEHAVVALQRGYEPVAECPGVLHDLWEVIPAIAEPPLPPEDTPAVRSLQMAEHPFLGYR
jgi:hypothetical protein